MGVPIILDTDIGTDVDDAFALVMAVKEHQLDLKAVTTVYGDVDLRARMARKILGMLNAAHIPVAAGEKTPLFDGKDSYWGGWEGKRLLTAADAKLTYDPTPAVDLMCEVLNKSQENITLIGIGPLTNIACLLQDHPEVRPKIAQIICMAGSLMPDDEEWNIQCDPIAAKIILTSGLPLRFCTRHFVRRPWITQAERLRLLAKGDHTVHVLVDLMDEFLSHKTRTHTPMYDPITLSTAFTNLFLPTVPINIKVFDKNHIITFEVRPEKDQETIEIDVPTDVHPKAFIDYLCDLLLS